MTRKLFFLICFFVFTGHAEEPKGTRIESEKLIRATLERLVKRSNDNAYVIIEDKRTKKFVQFSGGKKQGLVFDLPTQTLSPQELVKAKEALARFNIMFKQWEVYDRPGGEIVGTQGGFNKELGEDLDMATEITWAILTEVYRLRKPFDLSFEEN